MENSGGLMDRKEIMRSVQYHHDLVKSKGYNPIMTMLVGSQNYGLDHEGSDIDTYSLTVPPWENFLHHEDRKAGIIVAEDGHCNFKDFWVALSLLEKTSPNSVEYFTSKYIVYDPIYEPILRKFIDDKDKLYAMTHCNYKHMLDAIAGMGHQLEIRNMPYGKRYSHALRLESMVYNFLKSDDAMAVLNFRFDCDRLDALYAKLDNNPDNEKGYLQECHSIADLLKTYANTYELTDEQELLEREGLRTIDRFRWLIGQRYMLEETKKLDIREE